MVLSINSKEEGTIVLAQGHRNGRVLTQYDSMMIAHFVHVYNYEIDRAYNIVNLN